MSQNPGLLPDQAMGMLETAISQAEAGVEEIIKVTEGVINKEMVLAEEEGGPGEEVTITQARLRPQVPDPFGVGIVAKLVIYGVGAQSILNLSPNRMTRCPQLLRRRRQCPSLCPKPWRRETSKGLSR